ncbi:methyltransferase domain-containing protein [Egibacter rhizosphaerae]|uniref:Arsenite methyltransferase n=2 Tax=Egibacter rhizosphaerae TaxID=1670831 RepID=A0A411YDE4_9ACTN|nr:methyltransferase domain-containing protein [Egibacter rhizosphaerae]QBI19196.1 methyltransferase domain-containing protein [Egibacter rhizosphaerae]
MSSHVPVDVDRLRSEITLKYKEVAEEPEAEHHFHTGRPAMDHLGYRADLVDGLPVDAVDAFAGVANVFHWGLPARGERVVDVGSGAGADALIAARAVGAEGEVVGVDMNDAMLVRARSAAAEQQLDHVTFHEGVIEDMPLPDGWADVVISNGVMNLVPDKAAGYGELFRVLRPGGRLQISDICLEQPVPDEARADVDLWTA